MSSSRLGKPDTIQVSDITSCNSVSEVFNESLIIKVGPVVALNLLVEWLELLLDLILGSGNDELVLSVTNVGGVQDEEDLSLDSAVGCRVFDLENSISIS